MLIGFIMAISTISVVWSSYRFLTVILTIIIAIFFWFIRTLRIFRIGWEWITIQVNNTTFSFRIDHTIKIFFFNHVITELFPVDLANILDTAIFISFGKRFETVATLTGESACRRQVGFLGLNWDTFTVLFHIHFDNTFSFIFRAVIIKHHTGHMEKRTTFCRCLAYTMFQYIFDLSTRQFDYNWIVSEWQDTYDFTNRNGTFINRFPDPTAILKGNDRFRKLFLCFCQHGIGNDIAKFRFIGPDTIITRLILAWIGQIFHRFCPDFFIHDFIDFFLIFAQDLFCFFVSLIFINIKQLS